MTTVATPALKHPNWHTVLFVVLAGIAALLYGTALRFIPALWVAVDSGFPGIQNEDVHRWHHALMGAVTGLLASGVLLCLLWRPREKPLLVQYLALSMVIGLLLNLPFTGPIFFIIIAPGVIAVLAYPAPRALLALPHAGQISRRLLALSLLTTFLLALPIGRSVLWQIQGVGGEHAAANAWIADAEHMLLLLLAGIMASTKRPGWFVLGILTGLIFLYLGVAALMIPAYPGSWGVAGGVLALLGGSSYIAATLLDARKPVQSPRNAV
jgi:hypothetical protein